MHIQHLNVSLSAPPLMKQHFWHMCTRADEEFRRLNQCHVIYPWNQSA